MKRLLIASLVSSSALAANVPEQAGNDPRIKVVNYKVNDVIPVTVCLGVQTHFVFSEDERVKAKESGDQNAWILEDKENHVFIKPKAEMGDTNLSIVTNKRTYVFELRYAEACSKKNMTYQVTLRYPEEEARKAEKVRQADAIAAASTQTKVYNIDYEMAGDIDIGPDHAWDDGTFTYLQFIGGREIPSIEIPGIGPGVKPRIANRTMKGPEVVVVQGIAPKWFMRLDDAVVAVRNNAYNPVAVRNETGTASSEVRRVVKEKK